MLPLAGARGENFVFCDHKGDYAEIQDEDRVVEDVVKSPRTGKVKGTRPSRETETSNQGTGESETDEDEEETSEGSESQAAGPNPIQGGYDPSEFEYLPVNRDIQEMFASILSYEPQIVELETKLKPFLPEYIAAVGDIDGFIKVPRPEPLDVHYDENEGKETIGLVCLDEAGSKQSDVAVLGLKLRNLAKGSLPQGVLVKTVPRADQNSEEVRKWIESISDIHRSKPATNVHYSRPMPDIDTLMQEWPSEMEDILSHAELPGAGNLDADELSLEAYADIICSMLDIPVYASRVQSLHLLFSLYSEFKNSQHFKGMEQQSLGDELWVEGIPETSGPDRLIL